MVSTVTQRRPFHDRPASGPAPIVVLQAARRRPSRHGGGRPIGARICGLAASVRFASWPGHRPVARRVSDRVLCGGWGFRRIYAGSRHSDRISTPRRKDPPRAPRELPTLPGSPRVCSPRTNLAPWRFTRTIRQHGPRALAGGPAFGTNFTPMRRPAIRAFAGASTSTRGWRPSGHHDAERMARPRPANSAPRT